MSLEIASKQDVENIVDEKLEAVKKELLQALDQIGRPRRMTLQEVADNWGITKPYASKRLKKMYQQGKIEKVDFDSQPITVNRKEFFEAINGNYKQ